MVRVEIGGGGRRGLVVELLRLEIRGIGARSIRRLLRFVGLGVRLGCVLLGVRLSVRLSVWLSVLLSVLLSVWRR